MNRTRRRPSRLRALTLLETAVVSALTGVVFAVVVRWVVSLLLLSSTGSDGVGTGRFAAAAAADFGTDVSAAAVCDPDGLGVPVVAATGATVSFTVDSDGDTTADTLVTWTVTDSALRRGTAPLTGCTAGVTTWVVVADEVAAPVGTNEYFTPIVDGTTVAVPFTYDCAAAPLTCPFDALSFRATVTRDGTDPARIRVVAPLTAPSRL